MGESRGRHYPYVPVRVTKFCLHQVGHFPCDLIECHQAAQRMGGECRIGGTQCRTERIYHRAVFKNNHIVYCKMADIRRARCLEQVDYIRKKRFLAQLKGDLKKIRPEYVAAALQTLSYQRKRHRAV